MKYKKIWEFLDQEIGDIRIIYKFRHITISKLMAEIKKNERQTHNVEPHASEL